MSTISTLIAQARAFVTTLRSSIWAIDVRDGIGDSIQKLSEAIEQCYSDVSNPTLQTEALEAALQNKIDEGEMAALTIGDHTITAAKLAQGVIDNTLATSGAAADAKKTGDEIAAVKADLDALEADIVPDSIKKALYFLLNASAYDESVYASAGVSANLSALRTWAGTTAPVYQLESAFASNGSNQLDTGFAFQDGHIYTICFDVAISSANAVGVKAFFSNKPANTSINKYSEMAIERTSSSSTALIYWGYGLRREDSQSDVYTGDRVRAVATVDAVNYSWEQTFKDVTKNVTKHFSRNGNLESIATGTNIYLGATAGNRTPGFVGTLNEFKIYDRQFSSAEITSYLNEV